MADITVEFLKGYVDPLGRAWLKGLVHSFAADEAQELISKGIAKEITPEKPAKPAPRKFGRDEKDEDK